MAPHRPGRPKHLVIGAKDRVGRVQLQVRRAFIASAGRPLTIRDFLGFAFPRTTNHTHWHAPTLDRKSPAFIYCLKSQGRPRYARLSSSFDCCRRTTTKDQRFGQLGIPRRRASVLALQIDLPSRAAICGQGRSGLGAAQLITSSGMNLALA
jgi:hypothetical protein